MTKKLVSFDDQAEPGQGLPPAVQQELNATYVPNQKEVFGAKYPAPTRHPVFVVDREFPQPGNDYIPIWSDGDTIYAQSLKPKGFQFGPRLVKSTDAGATWKDRGLLPAQITTGRFLKLASGTLLHGGTASDPTFRRSTDDGATWTAVYAMRAETMLLGMQGWAQDEVTGHIYVAEYYYSYNGIGTKQYPDLRVLRSTDDGQTWPVFQTFPSRHADHPDRIDHFHSVQWDPVSQRIFVMAGDRNEAAGIYRVNSAGTSLTPVLLNRQISGPDRARAIGMMFFPTHIAWASDSSDGVLMRMARDQIGVPNPVVEEVLPLGGTGYWSAKADANGERWLAMTTPEHASAADRSVHVWCVEDNGATVFEAGSFPQRAYAGAQVTLGPAGQPGKQGPDIVLQSTQADYEWAIGGRIAFGSAPQRRPARAVVTPPPAQLPPDGKAGFKSMPGWLANQSVPVPESKFMGASFRASKSGTIAQLAVRATQGAIAGGGGGTAATLVRVGLYRATPDARVTLIGSSANDPTALASSHTTYTFPLFVPVNIKEGEVYVMGLVVSGAVAQPSILGWSSPTVGMPPWAADDPLFAVSMPGTHTDLPQTGVFWQAASVAPMLYGT